MKIELKSLRLHNFKGATDQKVEFNNRTTISGANAVGKTRIFDAFTWLLFGKDSDDRTTFNIKPLDADNKPLQRVDYSVTGVLHIDGSRLELERTMKESWVKKRGEEKQEFSGNETTYKANGVPVSQKDYQAKIASILNEGLFKMLTNPSYFNTILPWQERRKIIFEIAGQPSNQTIEAADESLAALIAILNSGKTLEEYRKEQAAQKKLLNERLKTMPARIDEVLRAVQPEPDQTELQATIATAETRITEINTELEDFAKQSEISNHLRQAKQNEIFSLRSEADRMEYEARQSETNQRNKLAADILNLERVIATQGDTITGQQNRIAELKAERDRLESEKTTLRERWENKNAEQITFNADEFICPACRRQLEPGDIEAKQAEMRANFNNAKISALQQITTTGKAKAARQAEIDAQVIKIENNIAETKNGTETANKLLEDLKGTNIEPGNYEAIHAKAETLRAQAAKLQNELTASMAGPTPQETERRGNLSRERNTMMNAISDAQKFLAIKPANDRLRARAAELTEEHRSLAQQIAEIERTEMDAEKYTRVKTSLMQERVNSLFDTVKIKLYSEQINGGLEETCETLINGVPYSDANNAAKINAGLDIINTLSRHYHVTAPIFIDNAEAVNTLLPTEAQTIALYVSTDKTLQISNY